MASIFKNGSRWRAQVRVDGRVRSSSFDTQRQAKRWAAEVEGGKFRLPSVAAERTTLAEALRRYLAEVTPNKKGAKVEASRIAKWLRDPLSRKAMAEIRSFDIARWRDEQVEAGLAPSTIKNDLNLISHCYKVAMAEWDIDAINPVRGVRMPKSRPGRTRRLEAGEYDKLKAAASADPNPWIEAIMDLAIETAMRLGEILSAKRNQISGSILVLREEDTKTSNSRAVPLSTRARAVIASLPASIDGRLIPANKHTIEHAWVRVCRLAGVEDLRIHDLRHEATSRLFEKGLDMMQVSSITGHQSLAMLKRYSHLRAGDLVELLG